MTKSHTHPSKAIKRARNLRRNQTAAEIKLWHALRNRAQKVKFRRQHPIGEFIVDFYCDQVKLCIEVDGPTHFTASQIESDKLRTTFLKEKGCKILRFTNTEIQDQMDLVLEQINQTIDGLAK